MSQKARARNSLRNGQNNGPVPKRKSTKGRSVLNALLAALTTGQGLLAALPPIVDSVAKRTPLTATHTNFTCPPQKTCPDFYSWFINVIAYSARNTPLGSAASTAGDWIVANENVITGILVIFAGIASSPRIRNQTGYYLGAAVCCIYLPGASHLFYILVAIGIFLFNWNGNHLERLLGLAATAFGLVWLLAESSKTTIRGPNGDSANRGAGGSGSK